MNDFIPFILTDYIDNPIALARIKAHATQEELAKWMNVSQVYISKIEKQTKVTVKLMTKVSEALKRKRK